MRSTGDLFWFLIVPVLFAGSAISLDFPMKLPVDPYQDGVTSLYLDRPYANTVSNPALTGQRVVRLPRHLRFDVELELSARAKVIRLLSDENENAAFADWERDDALRVAVPGRSCSLTRAVVRSFGPGTARLPAGGPVAAAPILVASDGEIVARSTGSWNKLTPAPDGNPVDFVMRNKRKLSGLALAYGIYAGALLRRRRARS
jgi:hypothetical protein